MIILKFIQQLFRLFALVLVQLTNLVVYPHILLVSHELISFIALSLLNEALHLLQMLLLLI
jgi:hypothetical protein